MTYFRGALRKDLLRQWTDRHALLIWLAIPLFIGVLMSLIAGGGGGGAPKGTIYLDDRDDSLLSGLLLQALGQAGGMLEVEPLDSDLARRRLEDGEGTALLVIPEGFGAAILEETDTQLELVTNPTQRILPAIVEEMLDMLGDAVFYLHRILGEEIRKIVDGPAGGANLFADADVARISVAINQVMESVKTYLFPPVLKLAAAADEAEEAAPTTGDISLYFLPGIVVMALLMAAAGLSEDVWRERQHTTLHRAASSTGGLRALLAGKLASGVVVMSGIAAVILLVSMLWHGHSPIRVLGALVWCALASTVFLGATMLIQLFASSQRGGSILVNSVTFPLLMVGGSFFPFEVMPAGLAAIGRRTPNGWAVQGLKKILTGDAQFGEAAVGALVMLAFGLVALWLAIGRAGRVVERS